MLRKSPQRTEALPVAHRGLAAPAAPQVVKNCLAIRDRGQMIAFVGADLNVPNEAVNLLKIKIAHFLKFSKAVNLLKIKPLSRLKPSTD